MAALLRDRITFIWLALIAATAASAWLGSDHGVESVRAATVGVLIVAFVKVRLVGRYFMELRNAPVALLASFEFWCVVVCSTVTAMYLAL